MACIGATQNTEVPFMPASGIEAIEKTIHKTNDWLSDLMGNLGSNDRKLAYTVLRSVLHTLRDRLPLSAVVGLGAQLPLLVRGIYYEGWHPNQDGKPVHGGGVDDFLDRVARELPLTGAIDPEVAVRAVLFVMDRHLDAFETEKVLHLLPRSLQSVWSGPIEPRDS